MGSHWSLCSSRLTQILQLLHLVTLLPARICQEFSDKILVLHKNTDSSNLPGENILGLTKILQITGLYMDFLVSCWRAMPPYPTSLVQSCHTSSPSERGHQVFHPALCSAQPLKQQCWELASSRGVEHLCQGSRLCRAALESQTSSAAVWKCTRLSDDLTTAGIHSEEHAWFQKCYILAFLTEFRLYRNRWEKKGPLPDKNNNVF